MLNDSTFAALIALLAAGDGHGAAAYLMHFPHAERTPANVRRQLAKRVLPEVMAIFDRVAPWLKSKDADDTAERIRRALRKAGTAGLNLSELTACVPRLRPIARRKAIEAMVGSMEVHVQRERTGGRTAERFRLVEFAAGIEAGNENINPFAWRPAPLTD